MRAKAQLRISVVVPTCGRPALLWRCLDALSRQTLHPTDYEIVVVDDGHSAATRRTVQQIALGAIPGLTPRVRYVQPPAKSRGPAGARNSGWRAARADVVAFTDDDTVPAPDWLAEGLRVMSSKVSAASGYIHVPLPFDPTDWDLNTAGLDGAEFATANCFVRRGALEAIGGFDERFRRPWREDSDLYFALIEHGLHVARAPRARVVHPVRPAPWGVSMRTQRNMLFEALLFKKHRRLYRAKISGSPPYPYYFAVAALLVAIAGAIVHAPLIAFSAGIGWLVWTARFTWRRLRGTSRNASHVLDMLVTSAIIPPLAVFWRLAGALRFKVLFA